MTLLTTVRPYQRLDKFDRLIIDERIKNFLRYAQRVRPKATAPKSDTVSPLPASPVAESEPEVDFLSETETQKRTRQPRKRTDAGEAAPLYDRMLKERIVALVTERGAMTSADIGQHFGMHYHRASVAIANMQSQGLLHIVGFTRNHRNQRVKLLHTDPNHVTPPEPVAPAAIVEDKRPARIPSLAAVDQGRALIERNFSRDSIAMQVFEQLCLRPRSIPELQKLFNCGSSCLKFMLDRMVGLGIVEKVDQERNAVSGRIRVLFGVAEAEATPPAPRLPPSPETIAKGRAKIRRGCLKGGGNTILVFDELCAHGPLTRGDLQARLGCHRTMIDVALRTLDAFGLVVDLGKTIGSETGHMRRLWDVKNETEAKA